jgi:hypothetical protein
MQIREDIDAGKPTVANSNDLALIASYSAIAENVVDKLGKSEDGAGPTLSFS